MHDIQWTIYLIVLIAAALLVVWFVTRGRASRERMLRPPFPPTTPEPPPPPAAPIPETVMTPAAQASPLPPAPPSPTPGAYQNLERRLHEVEALLGRLAGGGQTAAATPDSIAPAAPPSAQQVRDEVYRLAGEGLTASDIARRLELSRSEVELLLELRRLRAAMVETP